MKTEYKLKYQTTMWDAEVIHAIIHLCPYAEEFDTYPTKCHLHNNCCSSHDDCEFKKAVVKSEIYKPIVHAVFDMFAKN